LSVLGFSHIITEVKYLDVSCDFYKGLGYELQYSLELEVPPKKQVILNGQPRNVKVLYLSHATDSRIGIELIQHSVSAKRENEKHIIYGFIGEFEKTLVEVDPDYNKVIFLNNLDESIKQHIFLPTDKFEETLMFYKDVFNLVSIESLKDYSEEYSIIYGKSKKSEVLKLGSCLSPNWMCALHIVETDEVATNQFLNQYGFSCFCFLINEEEVKKYKDLNLDVVGPFTTEKTVNNKTSQFDVGFIKDPNGYPIEFYLSRMSRNDNDKNLLKEEV